VPKDVFLLSNLDTTIEDFEREIVERNLRDKFDIIMELK
jgi:hypothetical protein